MAVAAKKAIHALALSLALLSVHGQHHLVSAFSPLPASQRRRYQTCNQIHRTQARPSSPHCLTPRRRVSTTPLKTRLMVAPSHVDELPIVLQASIFVGLFAALGLGTVLTTRALESASKAIGLEFWRRYVVNTLPVVLGMIYAAAGLGHFAASESFAAIYPPRGTWGLWFLPGSAEFHVAWTGLVEALGGFGLLVGGVRSLLEIEDEGEANDGSSGMRSALLRWLTPASALTLLLLTLVVTPANIYMYTHGAVMGGDPLDLSFHYIRFGVQVLLLSLLATLARDSFFFSWGDELD